jgi:hypothetical protein
MEKAYGFWNILKHIVMTMDLFKVRLKLMTFIQCIAIRAGVRRRVTMQDASLKICGIGVPIMT